VYFLALVTASIGFVLASIYGVAIAILRRDRALVARDYGRMIEKVMRRPLGIGVHVSGEENLRRARPCVFVVNHQSMLDVPILSGIFPEATVLVAKKELRKLPLFGWIYEVTGNILIDRTNNPTAVQQLREAEAAIRERGVSVWIFPEGTRGRVPGELLPFKKGAFHLAIAAGVPIVPIVVSPVRQLFDSGRRFFQRGTVEIRVMDPIPTSGLSEQDVSRLAADVRARMTATLGRLRTVLARPGRQSDLVVRDGTDA
jgi:1-acyl-sn-glycerol-3-phosphate acyltransferase